MGYIIFVLIVVGFVAFLAKANDPTMTKEDLGYGALGLLIIIAILSGGFLILIGLGVIAWILKALGKSTT